MLQYVACYTLHCVLYIILKYVICNMIVPIQYLNAYYVIVSFSFYLNWAFTVFFFFVKGFTGKCITPKKRLSITDKGGISHLSLLHRR